MVGQKGVHLFKTLFEYLYNLEMSGMMAHSYIRNKRGPEARECRTFNFRKTTDDWSCITSDLQPAVLWDSYDQKRPETPFRGCSILLLPFPTLEILLQNKICLKVLSCQIYISNVFIFSQCAICINSHCDLVTDAMCAHFGPQTIAALTEKGKAMSPITSWGDWAHTCSFNPWAGAEGSSEYRILRLSRM